MLPKIPEVRLIHKRVSKVEYFGFECEAIRQEQILFLYSNLSLEIAKISVIQVIQMINKYDTQILHQRVLLQN